MTFDSVKNFIARYRKGIVAAAGVAVLVASSSRKGFSPTEVQSIGAAVLAAFGVVAVKNKQKRRKKAA